ncbi:MAG: mechanosensitive ion channel [Spirochaetia bacterium]|jgi:small-conductance mechanosensitive channel|nr:mechanosensitive ion channel [Spirochaetia bacterium]
MLDFIEDLLSRNLIVNGEKIPLTLLQLIINFIVPLLGLLLVYRFIIKLVFKTLKKSSLKEEIRNKIINYIKICFRIFIIAAVAILADKLLGDEVVKYFLLVFRVLNEPVFVAGSTSISILTIVMMIPVFFFASWAGKLVSKIIVTSSIDLNGKDNSKRITIAKLVRYGATILTLLIGLSIIGINLSSIAVLFGVLGIGLGFGLQNLVANLFAGFVIVITRPIREGDLITVAQNRGVITKINTISTVVTTLMNETIIVPNSLLISDVIYNDSYSDRSVIIKNSVSVSYNADIALVKSILTEIAKRNPYSLTEQEPDARLYNFGSSGIEMVLYSTIRDVSNRGAAIAWNNFEIWKELKEHQIEIPFNQMDVHIKKEV